jgi:hypothetical protein
MPGFLPNKRSSPPAAGASTTAASAAGVSAAAASAAAASAAGASAVGASAGLFGVKVGSNLTSHKQIIYKVEIDTLEQKLNLIELESYFLAISSNHSSRSSLAKSPFVQ